MIDYQMIICNQIDCPLHPSYVLKTCKEKESITPVKPSIKFNTKTGDIKVDGGFSLNGSANNQVTLNKAMYDWANIVDNSKVMGTEDASIIIVDNNIKIKTENISCNVACLFCKHRKKIDMRDHIIALQAKKLLGE